MTVVRERRGEEYSMNLLAGTVVLSPGWFTRMREPRAAIDGRSPG
jgi:hypothetical protein